MNRLWTTVTIIILLLVFIGYMVFDLASENEILHLVMTLTEADSVVAINGLSTKVFDPGKGQLKAVAVSDDGNIILGGESLYFLL